MTTALRQTALPPKYFSLRQTFFLKALLAVVCIYFWSHAALMAQNTVAVTLLDLKDTTGPGHAGTRSTLNFSSNVTLRITAKGAAGGSDYQRSKPGGKGAVLIGEFSISAGQTLQIVAGAAGASSVNGGGGGGGSGVQILNAMTPLIIAGGGGGGQLFIAGLDASISTSGTNSTDGSLGGTNGNGGGGGGGGGGYFTSGNSGGTAGYNGVGGAGGGSGSGGGGFGGGSGGGVTGFNNGGGGGGYSGGAGGGSYGGGGGGGSINNGTNQNNTSGSNTGAGEVIIEQLYTLTATAAATQPSCLNPTQGSVSIALTGDYAGNTTDFEYAIVSGTSFSGTPAFSTLNANPVTVTSGTGTAATTGGSTYTVRVRQKTNPAVYFDVSYTLTAPTEVGRIHIPDANFANAIRNNCSNCIDACNNLTPAAASFSGTLDVSFSNISDLTGIGSFTILQNLYCFGNKLTILPALPGSLQQLHCYNNQLTSLPALPGSLTFLYCDHNQLTSLPALPGSLQGLVCISNSITCLPTLPASLSSIVIDVSKILCLPNNNIAATRIYDGNGNSYATNTYPVCVTGTCCVNLTTPSIAVHLSVPDATLFCAGDNITYQSTLNGGGSGYKIKWYKNGTAIPNQTASTYSDNTLTATDYIQASVTPNNSATADACIATTEVLSDKFFVAFKPGPAAKCVSAKTILLDANGKATLSTGDIDNGSTAGCGIKMLSLDKTAFDCSNIAATVTVKFTVTDNGGNTSSCTSIITVQDNIIPVVKCPAIITVNNDAGVCGAKVSYTVMATDNCTASPVISKTAGIASGLSFPVGTTTNTFTATDASGNVSAACSFTVTVIDNEKPKIVAPADITVYAQEDYCYTTDYIKLGTPVTSDNCFVKSVTNDLPPALPLGVKTITWTVTDPSGNSATATQKITVLESDKPVILNCPNDITVTVPTNKTCVNVSWTPPTLANYCLKVSFTSTANPGDLFCKDDHEVTYTATDAQGHKAECKFKIKLKKADDDHDARSAQIFIFDAQSESNRVRLDFSTTGGAITDYFNIQKLNSAGAFTSLEIINNTVTDNSLQTHSVYDNAPDEGENYYQVQTALNDGTKTLSEVKKVNFTTFKGFSVFPNPTGDYLNVNLKDYSGKDVTLYFYNQIGVLQTVRHLQNVTSATPESIDVSDWTTGQYLIRAQSKGIRDAIQKVMVQK